MIYLLHFERPVSGHANHYLGWCRDSRAELRAHLINHRKGNGEAAALTRAAALQGIAFWLVRTWLGTRRDERRMKGRPRGSDDHLDRRCPLCRLSVNVARSLPPVPL